MHNELDRLAENAFAKEQGFAEGKAEGEANSKLTIAKAMLADKMDPSVVAKYTGLTAEEVHALL
jgi:predicted transposase/invertase (TIGR01784 family)